MQPSRRMVAAALPAASATGFAAPPAPGAQLANAARAQVGVTLVYDPGYHRLAYPGGDVVRLMGVCADVVVRAGRDAWHADLQRLVHEDMARDFAAYPSHRAWGLAHPDANIDHRRVLNLETYWTRKGQRLWTAPARTPGDGFAQLQAGDILTWRVDGRLPHVGVVAETAPRPRIVHNIGQGARIEPYDLFHAHTAVGHFRWRV